MHTCYSMEPAFSPLMQHHVKTHGPKGTVETKPKVCSPNGAPPPQGYQKHIRRINMSEHLEVVKKQTKRDIISFSGIVPTSISLEHVTAITVSGNRITFNLYTNNIYVDMENDETAKTLYDKLVTMWANGDV